MGGVSASASPTLIVSSLSAVPEAFETRSRTLYSPSAVTVPLMMPVDASMLEPVGSPVASKTSGALPEAAAR
jgi:hypothetical protein